MTTQYISRTYIDLWTSVEILVGLESEMQDKNRRIAARLSALVFAFLTLEAYLNHLGAKIRPDLWEGKNERRYFNGWKDIDGKKYYGPIGKLQFLYSQCGLVYDERSEEIQIIRKLKQFRDLLAHGKTEEKAIPVSCPPGQEPKFIVPEVWQYVHSNLRESTYTTVRRVIEGLHEAALLSFPDSNLEPAAFVSSFFQMTDIN
jgi:hypothetical protein